MSVSKNKGINLIEPMLDSLHAELGRRIDLDVVTAHLDMDRCASTPVFGIVQIAAITLGLSNHRHAL